MTISHREFHEATNGKRSGVNTRLPRRKRKAPPERHARKCVICHHPDYAEIEDAFLHWRSPARIASDHNIGHRNIYRHAHATGLYALRRMKLRCAAEMIVEKADSVTPSADAVIRAIRASCCINDRGEWHDPPRRVIHTPAANDAPACGSAPRQSFSEEKPESQDCAPQSSTQKPATAPGGAAISPQTIMEPGLNISVAYPGVQVDSNRQFVVRLEKAGNA